jgi:hypothetical protein
VQYPTLEQVEAADREQICYWWRFLQSPGCDGAGNPVKDFQNQLEKDVLVMNRITERYKEVGGFNSEISKRVKWTPPWLIT